MIFLALWTNTARIRDSLVGLVARLPARVQAKLLAAFLTIAVLLIMMGAVGLQVLNGVNQRTEELITLQRKIEAYRQVQHDTTTSSTASPRPFCFDDGTLDAALRQLNQFGYDVDRMEFVAKDEAELLGRCARIRPVHRDRHACRGADPRRPHGGSARACNWRRSFPLPTVWSV